PRDDEPPRRPHASTPCPRDDEPPRRPHAPPLCPRDDELPRPDKRPATAPAVDPPTAGVQPLSVSPKRRRSHHDLPRKHVSNADQRKANRNRSALRPRIHNLVTQLRSTRGELLGHDGDLSRLGRLVVVVAGRERCLVSRYN